MAKRYHILIDVEGLSQQVLNDRPGLEKFLTELPPLIGMSILYGPVVVEGIPANPGLSGFTIIDYSHISVHTFSETGQGLVDIFSCKEYSQEEAVRFTCEYFGSDPAEAKVQVVSW